MYGFRTGWYNGIFMKWSDKESGENSWFDMREVCRANRLTYGRIITNDKCQDELNTIQCYYDGGACCTPRIDDRNCTECICYADGTRHLSKFQKDFEPNPPVHFWYKFTEIPNHDLAACTKKQGNVLVHNNGICDTINNFWECDFDGGDCCLPIALIDGAP